MEMEGWEETDTRRSSFINSLNRYMNSTQAHTFRHEYYDLLQQAVLLNGIKTRTCFILLVFIIYPSSLPPCVSPLVILNFEHENVPLAAEVPSSTPNWIKNKVVQVGCERRRVCSRSGSPNIGRMGGELHTAPQL